MRPRSLVKPLPLPLAAVIALCVSACGGGATSVLHGQGKPTGAGDAELTIKNSSGASVAQLYITKTEVVEQAHKAGVSAGTEADRNLWGADELGNASIGDGSTWSALHLPPARYDVLVVATDHREQLVKRLNLQAGGKYVLELRDAWKRGRD
ncbi:MAG TPA: hypothetical protein VFQ61_12420 [Polyangiaceae bacterium]|nr:hypothetical protein [Polyangiaceae bacterium]